jgi:hypothetical protein
MVLINQLTSKEQLMPNKLIASKHEVHFGKVVQIDKRKRPYQLPLSEHVYSMSINLGQTQHRQPARCAQHLERIQWVNALPKDGSENLSGDETLACEGQLTIIDDDRLKATIESNSNQTC